MVFVLALLLAFRSHGSRAPSAVPPAPAQKKLEQPRQQPAVTAPMPSPPAPVHQKPAPAARTLHTADPCQPVREVTIPEDYDAAYAEGITVAWDREAGFKEPTVLARLIFGLLEEAAAVTGTVRREEVMVVIHPTRAAFLEMTGAPRWADGLYDGAVELYAEPGEPFGVRLRTLRHELMHAQVHTGVGCMPAWFNEGLATYYGDKPPKTAWLRILHDRRLLDLGVLEQSSIDAAPIADMDRAYGQSLAMLLYYIDDHGDDAIRAAVRDLASMRTDRYNALRLWERYYPLWSPRDLVDSLSKRVFKVTDARDVSSVFDGAVCCYGFSSIADFHCRGAPPKPDKRIWWDESQEPHALCEPVE